MRAGRGLLQAWLVMSINRRHLLVALGAAVPAAFIVDPIKSGSVALWNRFVSPEPFERLKDSIGERGVEKFRLINNLLTDRALRIGLVPGRSHYDYNGVHPDDQWSSDVLLTTTREMSLSADLGADTCAP